MAPFPPSAGVVWIAENRPEKKIGKALDKCILLRYLEIFF
jgi:hypothetical protein